MTVLERQDRNCYGRKIRPSTWQSSSIVEIPRQTPASAGVWFTLLAKSRIVGAPNSRIYIPLLRGVFLTQSTFHFGEQVGEKKIKAHVTSCEFSVEGKKVPLKSSFMMNNGIVGGTMISFSTTYSTNWRHFNVLRSL